MAFYCGKDDIASNFEEIEVGSSEIITKNHWHSSLVTIITETKEFELYFGFKNSVNVHKKK